ncbi:Outer membrane receptor proteins, mostly Fe transport [Lutibacter oricola]|uniref:Outer membrane receptor proteins, mostly Fe transport n=1 Tax=Lutibacter oricola TaxID=762486 RepID=A0A1H2U8X4_9FLAO|nr:Outer membrane receptor proteins, mostly Fe transport [Lutibacter oricola]
MCVFAFQGLLAQSQISGNVKDANGNPIMGANITIEGSTAGTTSDFDGKFIFTTTLEGNQEVLFSYVGYVSFKKVVNLDGKPIIINAVLNEGGNVLDEVMLTASSTFRSQKQAALSISSVKQAAITKLSANSQADIIRTVPGITAEGGGGETATNVFVRGLPSGGQYVFNPLQYDGMPLMSTFGLNSSAHDVYARPDIGMKGVEFVRGGSAILYGAGSVAGIINYTSKTGDTNEENIINVEWADKGRLKTDFYTGGKLGGEDSNTFYAFTGFIRKDDGPIETGLPTKGVQFRGNIKKKFDKGSFTLHGQYINDKAQFFMPLPLEGGTRARLKGNDGEDVYSLATGELANTSFKTPGGLYESPIEDGVYTNGGYVLGEFVYDFAEDLKFKSKVKFAEYKHNFALYIGGNGANPNPMTLDSYVNSIDPANQGYSAEFQGGLPISGNDLVIDNLHIDRLRPMTDYSGEASLTKTIDVENGTHNITLGTFLARTEAEDVNYQYRVLSEFNNNPRIINLNYTDGSGDDVTYSQGGLYDRIGMTSNKYLSQNRTALYISDEMIFDKWRFDVGFRYEDTQGTFNNGSIAEEQVYDEAGLTPALSNVKYGDGSFVRANVSASDWAVSLAALHELNDNLNIYANFSKGYFFPQIRQFAPIITGQTGAKYDSEKIVQFETGIKYGNGKLSGSVAAYYVGLSDRIKLTQGFDNGILVDKTRSEQNTRTIGLEANWNYKLTDNLSLVGSATYQDHELTKNVDEDLIANTKTTSNEGNELARQPNFLGNIGLNFDNKKYDAVFSMSHTGEKFAADNNNVELEAITIARLGAGYTFNIGEDEENLRLGFSIFNLFDDEGVTEGDPRNVDQSGDAEFFFGRPILPRRFFLTATFNF